MQPFISVVIPVYNRENLILETLDKVLNQTCQDFEIIIVDDGSTDNTRTVVETLNHPKIRYIYQENAGPSAARNNGIKNAQGEFIAFADSDDLWLPDKLEKQVNAIKSNPTLDFVTGWSIFVRNNVKNYVQIKHFKDKYDYIKLYLLFPFYGSALPQTSCMLIKKKCFEEVGYFDETMISKEDVDMWVRVALNYEFYCIPDYLDHHRDHEESLVTTTKLEEVDKCNLKFLDNVFNKYKIPDKIRKLKNKAYSYNRYLIGRRALYKCYDSGLARKYLFESFKFCPCIIKTPAFLSAFLLSCLPMGIVRSLKKLIR